MTSHTISKAENRRLHNFYGMVAFYNILICVMMLLSVRYGISQLKILKHDMCKEYLV